MKCGKCDGKMEKSAEHFIFVMSGGLFKVVTEHMDGKREEFINLSVEECVSYFKSMSKEDADKLRRELHRRSLNNLEGK